MCKFSHKHGEGMRREALERFLGFVTSIVRLPCVCRKVNLGKEKRYCYGVSIAPEGGKLLQIIDGLDKSYLKGPDTLGFETLSKEEALTALRGHEGEGLCHTVWTFRTPFIRGFRERA